MKIKYILFLLLMFILTPVYAAEVTTSLEGPTSIEAGEEFTLTVKATGENVWGISANLNYDTSKLTIVKYQGKSGFSAEVGTGIAADKTSGQSGTFEVISITFKATQEFVPGESTKISLTNPTAVSDSVRYSTTGTEKTIKVNLPKSTNNNLSNIKIDGTDLVSFSPNTLTYNLGETEKNDIEIAATPEDGKSSIAGTGKYNLKYGENKFNITVTAENKNKKTYTIIIKKLDKRSNNNYLKTLSITNAKINFNKNTQSYNITVDNNIDKIEIKATTEDGKSTVSGLGEKTLKVYLNTFNITVKAENETTRTYKINISRKDEQGNIGALSTNNKLKEIKIKGYQIEFKEDILKYNLTVENTVTKLDVTATAMDSNSTITIDNQNELVVGENTIKIEVISQSGDKKIYEIIVNRKKDAPVVSIKDLLVTINKTTSKEIEVEIKDEENFISSNIIDTLKGKDIKVNINKYENNNLKYVWTIDGKKIDNAFDFDTLVKFESSKEAVIQKLTNYAESIYLNYSYNGNLPKDTKFKTYVGNIYDDSEEINLYYYDETNNKMILKKENLLVKKGYVEYEIEHCSEYILTKAKLVEESKTIDFKTIIIILETTIIIGLITYIIIKSIKKKK